MTDLPMNGKKPEAKTTDVATTERPLPASLQTMIDVAKDRHKVIGQLKEHAVKLTRPHMWTIQGNDPWLNSQGTDHMERLFGMRSKIVDKEKLWEEDEAGERYFVWVFTVEVSLPNSPDKCDGVGSATSRDKFLGDGIGKRTLTDVEPNIIKKAWTDAKRTAVHRLLGLRGLSWEDLKKAGIDKGEVTQVDYKKGK